jgi:hypothetical protein
MNSKKERERVLAVLPEISDDMQGEVKDALAIRNAASVAQKCPNCDSTTVYLDPLTGGEVLGTFHSRQIVICQVQHDDWCPAWRVGVSDD